jgi:hypothetical protein
MKYLVLFLLAAALLWLVYLAVANWRKSSYDRGGDGGGGSSGDSGGGSSSHCGADGGSCGGDGGGGD